MPVSQAKRIAIEAYRLRNLDKHRQWSLNCYYRKRALLPEEERRNPVGRPKILKPPKPPKKLGRPKKVAPEAEAVE